MSIRKLIIIILSLVILLVITVGVISIDHPIILKWVTGSARHFGTSASATIYTNGSVNENIKVFYTDEPDNYLLSINDPESLGETNFLNLDLEEQLIGIPTETVSQNYDFIGPHLFQSASGANFSPLRNEMNGGNHDPQFSQTTNQLKFILPPQQFSFDSVRIKFH